MDDETTVWRTLGTREEQIRQLRDAMDRYARHLDFCRCRIAEHMQCSCGLSDALAIGKDTARA